MANHDTPTWPACRFYGGAQPPPRRRTKAITAGRGCREAASGASRLIQHLNPGRKRNTRHTRIGTHRASPRDVARRSATRSNQESLFGTGLASGRSAWWPTDHCAFTTAQKTPRRGRFHSRSPTHRGLEDRTCRALSHGVNTGRLTECRSSWPSPPPTSQDPRGSNPRKGAVLEAPDADHRRVGSGKGKDDQRGDHSSGPSISNVSRGTT